MGVPHANECSEAHIEDTATAVISPDQTNEMSLTIWQTVKANPKSIGYSVLMGVGPMCYGFDLIIISLAVTMPAFQHSYGEKVKTSYIIPSMWLALWNSMLQVGSMFGAFSNGAISDRLGRKFTFILGAGIAAAAVFLVYFSDRPSTVDARRTMFLVGKIVAGFAFGLINTSYLTMVSEIAPTRVRGPLLSCFTFFLLLGQLAGVLSVYARVSNHTPSSYRTVFAVPWAMAGAAIIVGFLVPESPVFQIKRNNISKALKAYKRLYSRTNAEQGLSALQSVVEHEMMAEKDQERGNYLQCFKGVNWRRTRIIIWANILQQLVGITMVINSTYFLELGGMAASKALQLNVVHIGVGLPCLVGTFWTMTRLGRRSVLLVGTSAIAVLWLSMGIAGCFPSSPSALLYLGICLIIIYEFYALSVGALYPVVSAESSSIQLRAASQSIGFFVNFLFAWLFNFTVPYMFNVDAGNLGGKVGFIFSFLSVCAFFIVFFEIPEMKNRTFAVLDEMFEKRLPTRKFKDYVCAGIEVPYNKAVEAGIA
ncbi:related to maltose permease [Phialocephala subalpina]|uniref:Related to maltose permease n=1 Tax=Phialocephala subalpina TaxID=576137 RepID=A0A1L7X9T9_9HELO|nr:related to maltose permease [Phialocephala subalpina]